MQPVERACVCKWEDIVLKEFLGDLYDDLMTLTNNDKQRVLNILEHCADKSVSLN